jgi:hypothetical protein
MENKRSKPQLVINKTYKRFVTKDKQQKSKDEVKEKKWVWSNFLVTIQTNYRAKSDADFLEFQDEFYEVLEELFDVKHLDRRLISFIDRPPKFHSKDEWKEPYVDLKATKIRVNIEEGGTRKGGRVHAHAIVQVKHRSLIWIDRDRVRLWINEVMAPKVKGSYIDVRLIKDWLKNSLRYIRKDQKILTKEEWKSVYDSVHQKKGKT